MIDKTSPNTATLIFPYLNILQDNSRERERDEIEVNENQSRKTRQVETDRQHAQDSPDFSISLPTFGEKETSQEFSNSNANIREHALIEQRVENANEVEFQRSSEEALIKRWKKREPDMGVSQAGTEARIDEDLEKMSTGKSDSEIKSNHIDEYA